MSSKKRTYGNLKKKGLHVCRCPVLGKILVKNKKRSTRLQVSCFRENIGEEYKKRAFRHMFLTMVSHYPPKNHILPLGGNLPPGWEPLNYINFSCQKRIVLAGTATLPF